MKVKTTASNKDDKGNVTKSEATVAYSFGETPEDAIKLFGPSVVMYLINKGGKLALQAKVRNLLNAGKKESEVVTEIAKWKPTAGPDPSEKALKGLKAYLDSLPDDATRKAFIQKAFATK